MTARDLLGVVLGAMIGAASRWVLGDLVGTRAGLLVANVLGCLVIGVATTRRDPSPWLTAGWCGALTSFSALALQLASDLDSSRGGSAVGLLAGTISGCAVAFLLGRATGRRVTDRQAITR